ncbi:PHP domain-containing protein [Desulfonatronospira sp.]|uniref:PHP domain-containing protein n=1 Tax=Desulfonatronospira sp. TaxID=1962951 RepID=UPI0025BCC511|nr:PHP domain-containing protein [Desulfonatronospira sp.]
MSFFFDLHVHSRLSACSILSLKDILSEARLLSLDGVCITDHNTTEARHQVREGVQDDGLCVIIGQEYSSLDGHFLIFGPHEEFESYLPAPEIARRVNQAGGVIIASHPYRAMQKVNEKLASTGTIRYAEGLNGRNSELENTLAQNWQGKHGVSLTGGSDAHCLEELGRVGTLFPDPVRNREELVEALKRRNFRPARNPRYKQVAHWLESYGGVI